MYLRSTTTAKNGSPRATPKRKLRKKRLRRRLRRRSASESRRRSGARRTTSTRSGRARTPRPAVAVEVVLVAVVNTPPLVTTMARAPIKRTRRTNAETATTPKRAHARHARRPRRRGPRGRNGSLRRRRVGLNATVTRAATEAAPRGTTGARARHLRRRSDGRAHREMKGTQNCRLSICKKAHKLHKGCLGSARAYLVPRWHNFVVGIWLDSECAGTTRPGHLE